jgi:hypothetical protein
VVAFRPRGFRRQLFCFGAGWTGSCRKDVVSSAETSTLQINMIIASLMLL